MKSIYKSICIALTAVILISFGNETFAHWSTKGSYGGKVKTIAVVDTNVYIGSTDGGIYISTTKKATTWKYINYTGLTDGAINTIAALGTSKKVIIGTPSGVFVSSNVGTTVKTSTVGWSASNTGLTNTNVLSSVTSGSNVFVGTGLGVFVSSDSAATWSSAGLNTLKINALAVDGTTLYAATTIGVYSSVNNGTSWLLVNTGLTTLNVNSLAISGGNIFAGTIDGVFTSSTTAISWSLTNTGLINTNVNSLYANAGVIYASTNGGVYTSPDANTSWTQANTGLAGSDVVNATAVIGTTLLAGTADNGIYKSSVSSISWSLNNNGYNNLDNNALYCFGNTVVSATNKGIFICKDFIANAVYVKANSGLTDSLHVTCLAYGASKLYAGTVNNGMFISADTGKTWTSANAGLSAMNIVKSIATGDKIFIAANNGDVYSTLQSNVSWILVSTGLPSNVDITAFATDSINVYAGVKNNGVYTLANNGTAWTSVSNGLSNLNITSLALSASNIFVGTTGGGVFTSLKNTIAFTAANNGLNSLNVQALGYADGYLIATYKGGANATATNGRTWLPFGILLYLPKFDDINSIAFTAGKGATLGRIFVSPLHNSIYANGKAEYPEAKVEIIAAAGANGSISPKDTNVVFIGDDQAFTFTPNANYAVDSVIVDGTKLSNSPSAYTFTNVTVPHTIRVTFTLATGINDISAAGATISIFPNPNNGECKIAVNSAKNYEVNIFDVTGKLVQHYVPNQELIVTGLVKGSYFVQLKNEKEVVTKKMIVQ